MTQAMDWNARIAALPGANILQTSQWAQLKRITGWEAIYRTWESPEGKLEAAALVLLRDLRLAGGLVRLRVMYVPRGPLLDWGDETLRKRVLDDLQRLAKEKKAIFIKLDADVEIASGVPGEDDAHENPVGASTMTELKQRGWLFSQEQIQFRNTVLIDLRAAEEDLLARMKQKTRYNIRLAVKKGVQVREGGLGDLPGLYRMYAETSLRDGFVIRDESYYRSLWEIFLQAGMLTPLIAEVDSEAVAALMLFHFAGKAWYIHGMSREAHREKMPNYLLQWEAMRRAKAAGCQEYDLWGAPDEFQESDGMWGVFRFKEGLGGRVSRTLGAWDYPARAVLYPLYTQVLPRLLDVMRRRGKEKTRQQAGLG
ncbi:MAG: peptidoglycan bridge formation glycyltransferase FemA/FemB family protein [Chloroflexi bacterium]|nr:peptidoglycan bridge formation glycyltransferase FemA/FemB family protein [Chloroflexota bacterium]